MAHSSSATANTQSWALTRNSGVMFRFYVGRSFWFQPDAYCRRAPEMPPYIFKPSAIDIQHHRVPMSSETDSSKPDILELLERALTMAERFGEADKRRCAEGDDPEQHGRAPLSRSTPYVMRSAGGGNACRFLTLVRR